MKQPVTIVLTGGGSGGHITPILSLAHALKQADPKCRLVYIGLRGDAISKSLDTRLHRFDEVYAITSGKFRRYHGESLLVHLVDIRTLALNIRDFFRVIAGIFQARRLLNKIKPNLVFSKGGFVVVPVGIAARLQNIPIITHDSDAAAGLANRIVGRWAAVHTTGMPPHFYNYPKDSIRYVGIPLDERIRPVSATLQQQFKKELGWPAGSQVLVVGGAGLGAHQLNQLTLKAAPKLLEQFPKLQIVHLSGEKHLAEVNGRYATSLDDERERVTTLDFTADFYKYTGAADLIITRAGATTIAELALQHKAVILIPAPQLTAGQQLKNAQEIAKADAAVVLDNKVKDEEFFSTVSRLLSDSPQRQKLANNLGAMAKADAADELAGIVLSEAKRG